MNIKEMEQFQKKIDAKISELKKEEGKDGVNEEVVALIKKSKEEIGEKRYKKLAAEVDMYVKETLGEEKWKVYLAANGSQESEDKLIREIGKEKYFALLDEINKDLSEKFIK